MVLPSGSRRGTQTIPGLSLKSSFAPESTKISRRFAAGRLPSGHPASKFAGPDLKPVLQGEIGEHRHVAKLHLLENISLVRADREHRTTHSLRNLRRAFAAGRQGQVLKFALG